MDGAVAVKVEALKIASVDPMHIRQVSWAVGPKEPAMVEAVAPRLVAVAMAPPERELPAPVPTAPGGAVFEPLVSAPHPEPLPRPGERETKSEHLKLALETLKAQGERLAEQARSDALELGILIARRILEKEITANLDGIFSLLKSAIRRAGEDHITRVRVNPDDLERLQGAASSDFSMGKIELEGDPSLGRGDVMVDTEQHTIDGRLSTRFEELVRQLDGNGP